MNELTFEQVEEWFEEGLLTELQRNQLIKENNLVEKTEKEGK